MAIYNEEVPPEFVYRNDLYSVYLEIFLAVLAMPVLEEIAFRFSLAQNSKGKLILSGICYLLIVAAFFFNGLTAFFILVVGGLLIIYLSSISEKYPFGTKIALILSSVLFAALHYNNYADMSPFVMYSCLAATLGFGLIAGSVRVKYNFFYAILVHVLWNGMVACVLLFVDVKGDTEFSCSDYDFMIEEHCIFNQSNNRIFAGNSELIIENGDLIQFMYLYFMDERELLENYYSPNHWRNFSLRVDLENKPLVLSEVLDCLVDRGYLIKKD